MDELSIWRERAIKAEGQLREIAQMPNDSIGWKQTRQAKAMEYIKHADIPDNILIYIRQSTDPDYPAEICVRDHNVDPQYNVWAMSSRALYNMVRTGVGWMAQDKFFKHND